MKKIGLKTGFILFVMALAACGATLLDTDFSGSSGPLAGNGGWIGRDTVIQLDGKGTAGLVKSADGFVKHPLTVPENAERIRVSAKVRFSALPDSAMRNHHKVGKEQPAWIALGFTDNPSGKAGLSASKLSASVSSDGKQISIGLGQAVGAAEPAFGVVQAAGDGSCELALEYDFAGGTATALLNGTPVLTGKVELTAKDFTLAGFQLRRIAQTGGIDELKVEYTGGTGAPVQSVQLPKAELKPELPFGSRINTETVRAHEIEARIDGAKTAAETIAALKTGWTNPPSTYRTHTRWWWPGNAVTKEGIDFQLQEMKDKGFGGVEIMSFISIYTKGRIEFNSGEFVAMTKYTVDKARSLGMEVTPALTPGWNNGHALVPEEDGGKAMVYYEADVNGGSLALNLNDMKPGKGADKNSKRKFDALVAVALKSDGTPGTERRVDLTAKVSGKAGKDQFTASPDLKVNADLPAGRWRLMAFWTALTGQKCAAEDSSPSSRVVDHLNKSAVENYLKNAGARFAAAMGGDYGQTVDSFFGDSFEIKQDFSYWSAGLYERFEKEKGYDLRPYLPMLVYGGAPETPYIRYDAGSFLSRLGMETMVHPLADYAAANHVGMRQQPHYRFTADIIEQSGVYQRPETENTKRSFDPMFWHKLTASGAWLYPSEGRKWVSCEAFTFINEKYRTTMEEIKRGTDLFLRDGITQFYNHGYFYTPEKELAPSRDLLWMNRISHVNIWWPWYRGLADYQARAAFLSRQGRPECAVLVYAPYPTLWSERAEYPVSHVRDLPFGPLPKILVANGYDFDCVNDDLLLNHAQIKDGKIVINGFDYSVLILPRTMTLAPETLEKVAAFVKSGGTVMALHNLPERSAGLVNHEANDARLAGLRDELFSGKGGAKEAGKGKTWFFPDFDGLEYLTKWSPGSVEWEPAAPLSPAQAEFIKALRSRLTPDFEIAGKPQSDGLTFRHTVIGAVDCWFIC
ncbi:MAG: glycosyl hydrolase, partial [Kiritimatiellales bacterium]